MQSLWTELTELPSFPALNKDIKTDVLIIGGGIAGLLTAYMLKQKGVNCVLVEKEKICHATTALTTAKITFQHGLIYHKILKSLGSDAAQKYLYAGKTALKNFEVLSQNISCDFEKKTNFVYSTNNKKLLEKEILALDIIGFKAKFYDSVDLPLKTAGAVAFENQAQFNPLKFINSICNNLNIYENTNIKELIGTTAYTDKFKIYAKKVIVATHFPFINRHGCYFLKMYQHRSYVLALKKAVTLDGMYVDEAKVGYSFRNYGDLLLLGGGDHRTGKKGGAFNELRQFSRVHYPQSKEVYHWAAQDCITLDELPYIGQYSKNTPDVYVATGFNKWGMTSAMTAATLLSDAVVDIKHDYADIFNPSRSILKPQLLINGVETTANLITPTKPRCTHLGCALKWNKYEHSWDCPCHGSRFSNEGRVLENPATDNLQI